MPPLALKLLGGFELSGGPSIALPRKAQALLAYLALGPKTAYTRSELAGLLWGSTPDAQARGSLRQALSGLRRALGQAGATALTMDARSVALDRAAVAVDALDFRALLADARPDALERAVALYTGDLLHGLHVGEAPFEEWLVAERERLREQTLTALGRLVAWATDGGLTDKAVALAMRLLAVEPAHEPTHRALMRLHASQGRVAGALRQYQRCVDVLQHDLGVEPDRETKELYQAIVRARSEPAAQAGSLEVATSAATSVFVGREAEQARIDAALTRALAGPAQVVAIVGEAGIGKSRLIARVTDTIVERGARVLIGRAYAAEQILPCGPWLDALRNAGIPLPESEEPAHLVEGLVTIVDELARAQVLALILEDVHWADDLSQRVLAVLARRLAARKLLLIVSVRDDELDDRPLLRGWLADLDRERRLTRLALPPLSQPDIEALVRALGHFDGAHAISDASARVWATSEGHPLIAVETLHAMEDGPLEGHGPVRAMPARVTDIVATRLDRLTERGRDLVAAAAVIGRDFDFELVRHAAGVDEGDAAAGIEELVRRRLVRVIDERFEFTHERIRDVVYERLIAPRRRLLHRRAGEALEALHAADLGPHQTALGRHFHAAEAWDKAVRYLHGAAEWALARTAHREAAACLEQAIADAMHLPEADALGLAIDLRLDFVRPLARLGERAKTAGYIEEAERFAARLGDPLRAGRIKAYRAFDALAHGHPGDVRRFAEDACELGTQAGDATLVAVGTLALGYAAVHAGDYRDACASLQRLLGSLPETASTDRYGPQIRPYAGARVRLGEALVQLGDFAAAAAHQRDAIAYAQRVDHGYSEAVARWLYGETLLMRGDPDAAAELERALTFARERETFWVAAVIRGALGWARALDGQVEEGRAMVQAALADFETRGITSVLLESLILRLGEATLLADDLAQARALADRALELTLQRGERGLEAWALRLWGETERLVSPAAAEHAYGEALARASELGMRPLVAVCHVGLGKLSRATGRIAEGDAHRATAAALFRDLDMRPWPDRA